ncbi:hypothetical protein [Spirosoma sp.]|uniref:hypothetical protein n=1 Tax=Spirosoma sp. TaxID=1899569 RepID=UPI002604B271|nr:hypothetical protein [Spirosoma sp.]MCX6217569.1 hypothetical protein [Spirosoma sp.]
MSQDKKPDIYRWVFFIPIEDVVSPNNHGKNGKLPPCLLCGQPVKNATYSVHLLTDGNLVSSDQEFDNSQGFHVIGNNCRHKLPNNFVFRITA